MTACTFSHWSEHFSTGDRAVILSDPSWSTAWLDEVEQRVVDQGLGSESLVVFSSGTTSMPRGIVRTWASWQSSASTFSRLAGMSSDDAVAVTGPLHSTVFAHGVFHAQHIGATVGLAVDELTTVVHTTPGMIAAVLARRERGELPSLRVVTSGGDRLPDDVWSRASACGVGVLDYYGAAELSFVGYRTQKGPYQVFPGVSLDVRGGVAWVASPFVAERPLDRMRPGQWVSDGAWHSVGDVVHETSGGFVVRGRGGALTTGGHTVILADVEQHALALRGVTGCVAVARESSKLGQRLDLAVAGKVTTEAVREHFSSLPAASRPGRIVVCSHMPLLPSGKTDRVRAAQRVEGHH